MSIYKHKQHGTFMFVAFGIPMAASIAILYSRPTVPVLFILSIVLIVLSIALLFFRSLTIEIRDDILQISLGVQILSKTININDIANFRTVRNSLRHGFGIRSGPTGDLYSVSGFDAIEITLRNGSTVRIGTDDPQGLSEALRRVVHQLNKNE